MKQASIPESLNYMFLEISKEVRKENTADRKVKFIFNSYFCPSNHLMKKDARQEIYLPRSMVFDELSVGLERVLKMAKALFLFL